VKKILSNKWVKRLFVLLIVAALSFGWYEEREARHRQELFYDIQIAESIELIDDITIDNIAHRNQVEGMGQFILHLQQTIYKMYQELRKHDKTIPPWEEDKPLLPEDNNFTI